MEECEKRITVRLPCVLYEKLERIAKEKGYKTFSEMIRDIIRDFVERNEAKARAELAAAPSA